MYHSFDSELATEYGILEAILLNHIQFWIEKNKANGKNFFDGYYWTYNSTRAYHELFPYVSQRQIQTALKHLREEGILQTGNYNSDAYDRTMWYAFTLEGESIMQKSKIHDAELQNGHGEDVAPIPDNKPYIYTDKKPDRVFRAPTVDEVRAYCLERKNDVDPQRFVDYYQARGWMIGKSKMKDWKAAVRTWEKPKPHHEPDILDGIF